MIAPPRLPSPAEIIAHLDRIIEGQERAKRDLACAVYWHYLGLAARDHEGRWPRDYGRQHVMMMGPTGSGKSYMVRTLAEWMGVPYVFMSATAMVDTGYVGDDVETPFRLLLAKAGGNVRQATSGIVFLDEVDKIRCAPGATRDISGEGVQNGLLTILDGTTLHLTPRRNSEGVSPLAFDTSRTLIVATGAFVGLPEIVLRRRGGRRALGFHGPAGCAEDARGSAILDHVTSEDLVAFGMIPEFIGRFGTITATRALSRIDLAAILTEREDSALERCRAMFALHGIELEVTREAIEAIAERALQSGTGARGLNGQLRRCLDAVTWQLPDLATQGIRRVIVGREVVEDGQSPRSVTTQLGRRSMADVLRRQSIARRKLEVPEPERAQTPVELEVRVADRAAPINRGQPPSPPISGGNSQQTTFALPDVDPIAQRRNQVNYRRATSLARWRWLRYERRWWADASFRTLCDTIVRSRLGVQEISEFMGMYLEEPPEEVNEAVEVLHHVRTHDWNRMAEWVLADNVDDPTAEHVPPTLPAAP